LDTFVRDNLPPAETWPLLDFSDFPELRYPPRLNCATELLGRTAEGDQGDRAAIHFEGQVIRYRELLGQANQIAHVLVEDLGLVPGQRVLLRGTNHPNLVACWFAVLKAGGIAVTTMPLLRVRELVYILDKARVNVALCDERLSDDLEVAVGRSQVKPNLVCFDALPISRQESPPLLGGPGAASVTRDQSGRSLQVRMAGKPTTFADLDTAADDPALIAFTSGTTGQAKGTVHFHRDVLAVCDTFSRYVLRPRPDDVFCGTPPLAFTYGLGGLLLFPFRVGASTVLLEKPAPEALLQAVQTNRATICHTAPTMYRSLLDLLSQYDLSSLRSCVSAGETLPRATFEAWLQATGLKIVDGIGATELLHIFISAAGDEIRPGSTGKAVPGYRARVIDDDGQELPPGTIGRLAVQGPTGCRYLADPERQRSYVQDGWNLTGDAYLIDQDGYFWYQARADDMIISAGYNIAGPEVEAVLLEHPRVRECGVVGAPDPARGSIVKAFVVLRDPADACPETVLELQEFVKRELAPYKYPRQIEFVESLPRTETGKLQRFKLRERAQGSPAPIDRPLEIGR
jgi:2-aminobenzoate-CoA ligase